MIIKAIRTANPVLISHLIPDVHPDNSGNMHIWKEPWHYKLFKNTLCKLGIHRYDDVHEWSKGWFKECRYCRKRK